jgi:hypothetical protein
MAAAEPVVGPQLSPHALVKRKEALIRQIEQIRHFGPAARSRTMKPMRPVAVSTVNGSPMLTAYNLLF